MKKRFQNNLAEIIFRMHEKPFRVWILVIIIQTMQLMQTGMFIISLINPQNTLFYFMRIVLGLFTLRTLQEQMPLMCILIQGLYLLYLVFLLNKFIFGPPQVVSLLGYTQIWCPILITISIQSLNQFSQMWAIFFCFLTVVTSMILWALRIFVLNQDFISRNAKFSNLKSIILMSVYCVQSVLLYLKHFNQITTIYISISVAFVLIAFIISLVIIQNVDEQLQYLHFISYTMILVFYLVLMIIYFIPEADYLVILVPIFFIFLERISVFKIIFEMKYNILLDRVFKHQGEEDLIILLEIVGGTPKMKPQGKILKGRANSFWTSKNIQFNFHMKGRQICMALGMKKGKQQLQDVKVYDILKQQTYSIIEEYIIKRIKTKSKILSFVMVSQCIKRQLMIKALTIHSSIVGELSFNERILKKVLKLRLSHASNVKDKMGSINQISYGLCCLQNSVITSKIDQVKRLHVFFDSFLMLLIKHASITSKLMSKLSLKVIKTNQISDILQEQAVIKEQLDQLISCNSVRINKQTLVLFYIYYSHFCSQKFSLFYTLAPHFMVLEKMWMKSSRQWMVCLVSATNNNLGALVNANHTMVQFFHLDFQNIKQGATHIEDFLPRPLSIIHNSLIERCLQTGLSNIIGTTNRFYVVKGINAYPVEFQVRFQPYLQGINFSCQLRLINDESFILYDKSNEIVGFSQMAQWILPKKKLECKYLYDIFGQGRRTVHKSSQIYEVDNSSMPDSTKSFLSTKKYQINMKMYQTHDFQLGICRFSKNQLGESAKHISCEQSTKFINQVQKTNQSEDKPIQQNRQFMILQNKISSMSQNISIVWKFVKIIVGYGVFLITSTITFYVIIILLIEKLQTICNYQNNLFQDSPETFLLGIDRIFNMYHAIYNNYYPKNVTINGNQTILKFLDDQYQKELQSFIQHKSKLYNNLDLLPENFVSLIISQYVSVHSASGQFFSLSLYPFLSYILDRKKHAQTFSAIEWTSADTTITHKYIINYTLLQLQKNIYSSIFKEIQSAHYKFQTIIMSILICIESIATIGIIIMSIMLYTIVKHKNKLIHLLTQLDNKHLNVKHSNNQKISLLLNAVIKFSLNNLLINQNTKTIQFHYGPNNQTFTKQTVNIEVDSREQIETAERYKLSARKTLNNSNFQCKQYLAFLAVSIAIFLPIFIMLIIGHLHIAKNAIKVSSFYEEFVKINTQTSKCAAGLLNVNTMIIAKNNGYIFGLNRTQFFRQSQTCIIDRQIETKLKTFVTEIAQAESYKKIIYQYLYSSKCNQSNPLCAKQLNGAMLRGLSSGLQAYLSLSSKLYNHIYNWTRRYSGIRLQETIEALESFTLYIKDMMEMTGFVYEVVKSTFIKDKNIIIIFLSASFIAEIALIVIFIGFIFKSKKGIYQVKKQIFSVLPVDTLVENINFNFEIRNIS